MKHERRPGEGGLAISGLGKFRQVQKTANRRSVQARSSPKSLGLASSKRKFWDVTVYAARPDSKPPERLRLLAARLHALGPRPLFLWSRLERYAKLDPHVVRLFGADSLPPAVHLVWRRR
jgi:hypothetical protein